MNLCPGRSARRFAFVLGVALTLAACKSHTVVNRHESATLAASAADALVILGRARGMHGEPDHDYVACVTAELARRHSSLRIIDEQAFVDAMYPWFETSTAPTEIAMLKPLFANAPVRERFDTLGVEYLVWIDGSTETVDKSGGVSCAVGPAGAGCFGLASWDDEADYEAALWQVATGETAGKVSTRTTGTSYVPAVIIPLPLLARVKNASCEAMAGQLSGYISTP